MKFIALLMFFTSSYAFSEKAENSIPQEIIEKAFSYTGVMLKTKKEVSIVKKDNNIYKSISSEYKFCHGVLISPNYFLTAAHCFFDKKDLKEKIFFIQFFKNKEGKKIHVSYEAKNIYTHPFFKRTGKTYQDIAIVEINSPSNSYFNYKYEVLNLKKEGSQCIITDWRFNKKREFQEISSFIKNLIDPSFEKKFSDKVAFYLEKADQSYLNNLEKTIVKGKKIMMIYLGKDPIYNNSYVTKKIESIKRGYSGGPLWCYDQGTRNLFLNGVTTSTTSISIFPNGLENEKVKKPSENYFAVLDGFTLNWIQSVLNKKVKPQISFPIENIKFKDFMKF